MLEESSSLGTNLFQNSREFNIFNTMLSESEAYDSRDFNFPVEAVRVWRMKDNKLVSTMEDVMEYMKFNNISSKHIITSIIRLSNLNQSTQKRNLYPNRIEDISTYENTPFFLAYYHQ